MVLVAYEINQNSQLARTALVNEEFASSNQFWADLMGETPADVIAMAVECPEAMTYSDFIVMDAYLFTGINLLYRDFELAQEDAGEFVAGTPFFTSEYIHGEEFLAAARDADRGRLLDLTAQVCRALQYIHDQGVVHYDVKPANILVTPEGTARLVDFGLATLELNAQEQVLKGTPNFVAPEVIRGVAVDHRADLYALGVTFFEMLTGHVPFQEGDVAYHHRHTAAPDLRDEVAGIPNELAELVLELMAKDPVDRPQNAGIIRDRMQRILDGMSAGSADNAPSA